MFSNKIINNAHKHNTMTMFIIQFQCQMWHWGWWRTPWPSHWQGVVATTADVTMTHLRSIAGYRFCRTSSPRHSMFIFGRKWPTNVTTKQMRVMLASLYNRLAHTHHPFDVFYGFIQYNAAHACTSTLTATSRNSRLYPDNVVVKVNCPGALILFHILGPFEQIWRHRPMFRHHYSNFSSLCFSFKISICVGRQWINLSFMINIDYHHVTANHKSYKVEYEKVGYLIRLITKCHQAGWL